MKKIGLFILRIIRVIFRVVLSLLEKQGKLAPRKKSEESEKEN